MRFTPFRSAACDALPRTYSFRLHVVGQRCRCVDLVFDLNQVGLDFLRTEDGEPQPEAQQPDAEFHRREAIHDAVRTRGSAITRHRLDPS
jgi:hypothetical protein